MATPSLLVILDGFGHRLESEHNAIALAQTPVWDALWQQQPHTLVSGSGLDVGLPDGQMGNSEVGHMNLGAGRVVYQDFTRINKAIEDGSFAQNEAFSDIFAQLEETQGALHVMGLLSPGGVHSHEDQIFEIIRLASDRGLKKVYLHAFLDGRDTPPKSATDSLRKAEDLFRERDCGRVASLCGRYFAMDRDRNWARVERAYNLIVRGEAPFHATTSEEALTQAYTRGESDEFVQPTSIHSPETRPLTLHPEDAVLFMNFRSDRARQLTRALLEDSFDGFKRRSTVGVSSVTTLTRYADDIYAPCAFDQVELVNTLGEYLAHQDMRQLRISETEKYAHVTFFFSGGREEPYPGEERILIPSPKVETYDLAPAMSAHKVTQELIRALQSQRFDVIVCNYANGDMVGHCGKLEPAIEAVETLDHCLGLLRQAVDEAGGQMLITADHGNVEQMSDPVSGQAHTAHTENLVPLVYVGPESIALHAGGALSDITPTLLHLMGLEIPAEMSGTSLANFEVKRRA